jgi:hypothetical protein
LPSIQAGSLSSAPTHQVRKGSVDEPFSADGNARAISVGERNNALFSFLLGKAIQCADLDALLALAKDRNSRFALPLAEAEVARTVRSVWGYREGGNLWSRQAGRVVISADEVEALRGNGYALMLLAKLRMIHAARREPFAISDRAMSDAEVLPGWGRARYRSARDALLSAGLLKRLHHGGDGPNDPSIFCFQGFSN